VKQKQPAEMTNVGLQFDLTDWASVADACSAYLDRHLQCSWVWCWFYPGNVHRIGRTYSMNTSGGEAGRAGLGEAAQDW